jgi:hypothetical protein
LFARYVQFHWTGVVIATDDDSEHIYLKNLDCISLLNAGGGKLVEVN